MNCRSLRAACFGLAAIAVPTAVQASAYGFLGNFDVVNDTGTTAHGFEIELEDLFLGDISDVFGGPGRGFPSGRGFDPATSVQRYGAPSIEEYNDGVSRGVRVTYRGLFDGDNWDFGTPSGTFITPGDNCWSGGGVGYGAGTPCDHFGVGTRRNATKTSYSWLLETATPGELAKQGTSFGVAAPRWNVQVDPGDPNGAPIVIAEIEAPDAEVHDQYGDAVWVKIFKIELENEVELEELVAGNPVIDGAEVETEWKLLQDKPGAPGADKLARGGDAPVGENADSVIRRFEFYAYIGAYDAENHEALVGDDSNPLAAELGHYLGAQNGAVNLNVAPVPLPPAAWLFGSAVVALGGIAKRRRR